ncbi:glycerol acyltransferase [Halovulum dunhuangense]|uniref:Glycerol acyltransferase n=1 Tax=Halovulum dunhuangense TaxID=1505036 RepID=A0A849L4C7_9RHOB|nr:1-acyl-sn-glycerol-3-phosphate acyltransferase [Halovulum dunhuangense]NNU81206.1 glycerol acyltransferase [Halovulum dunhuangense]
MRERVDPLIAERAPWLYRPGAHIRIARGLLHLMLGYDLTIQIAEEIQDLPAPEMMDALADMIAQNVDVSGLERIPESGPAMIVCNHPTGIADGIILWSVLRQRRPDLFFFANKDAIRVMPQLADIIAPVEWRPEKRSHGSNRETLTYAANAFKDGRMAVLFPSGRLAKRRGLKLYERPWMPSAAMLARKYELPVVPMHIKARNSALFYLFDAIHPTLRDVTLFHEVINKTQHSFKIRTGKPLDGASLSKDSVAATDTLLRATMRAAEEGEYSVLIPRARGRAIRRRKVTTVSL